MDELRKILSDLEAVVEELDDIKDRMGDLLDENVDEDNDEGYDDDPDDTDAAYIKLEENKIYWVKSTETGAVDIW